MTTTTAPEARTRAAGLDAYRLAEEVARHAAVAARHLSYSELWQARGNDRAARDWAYSADRAEEFYLAEVDEANRRLAAGDAELVSYLRLFGALTLVDEVAVEVALGRACGHHDRPLPGPECQ